MRMLMRVKVPVESGNTGLSEGTLPATLQQIVKMVEPEAVYIGPDDGVRCVHIFFDLKDPSDIPAVTEPFFQNANASVELLPVMNMDDMFSGMAMLG